MNDTPTTLEGLLAVATIRLLAKLNNTKTMIPEMIIGIVILALMTIGGIYQRRNEKREWNGGICAISGKPWEKFDHDSQGGRGYKDNQGNYVWVSYKVDSPANASVEAREKQP